MTEFPNAEKISRIKNPLDWSAEKNDLMVSACREMAIYHYKTSPELKHIYDRRGFNPESIKTEKDLPRIPAVGVTAMKHFLMTSLPHDRAVLKLTSSGTRGQKTQIWMDDKSLDRVQAMLDTLWEQEGLIGNEPTNYVLFVYDPDEAKDLGIAFSDKNQQRFAPVHSSYHTVKKDKNGNWEFRIEETITTMKEFAAEGKPVRLFGIPSFVHELLLVLKERGPIKLPPKSMMMTGGGWKAAEDKKITRDEFRALVTEYFGIPGDRIRDGYGMAEHCAPYMDCSEHRFHVPVYNRIFVRNPETMELMPPGMPGLLELVTPFNAMMPTLSILSTDLGMIDPDPCACGRNSPTFTLLGRGGLTKHKGCAIHASEIIRRG
jgi:phenylacetate-coenzyme A ligase PaaK-like adenylate-forming protein